MFEWLNTIREQVARGTGRIFTSKYYRNVFNEAFYRLVGDGFTQYDENAKTYIEKGYNHNPTVYAIIQQQSTKAASVPWFIQKESNKAEVKKFNRAIRRYDTKNNYTSRKLIEKIRKKAFEMVDNNPDYLGPPLPRPNPHQTWTEFVALSETYLRSTGNIYWYMPEMETGSEAGQPYAIYILPAHITQIVLKSNADLILDTNPVKEYILVEGYQYDCFPAEQVVHITFSNPNYATDGRHLYGQSPLRAALKDIQIINEGKTQGIKTMQNSGAFGFIHGKSIPLQEKQAKELKDRLQEMDQDAGRLSKIAGISTDIGFTRINLSTKELEPWRYTTESRADIANCLGWSVLLLNDTTGAKYDNLKQVRQRAITDTIMPDLELIQEAFNTQVLKRFKGYERAHSYFDFSLLPEMQADVSEMVNWLTIALRDGVINRDEYREAINYNAIGTEEFLEYTVQNTLQPLEEATQTPAIL